MNEYAKTCRDNMRNGVMPPHNWQRKVSSPERRKIYDAWVDWYIDQIKSGNKLPGRGTSSCIRGLTEKQKARLYSARGFESTSNMSMSIDRALDKEREKKAKYEFLKCHGGQHTQDVMADAAAARRKRLNHIYWKYRNKRWRRMIASGFNGMSKSYDDWCYQRMINARENRWSEIRKEIKETAVRTHFRNEELWKIEKSWGSEDDFVKMFRRAGIENLEKYVLNKMPGIYGFKIFKDHADYLIGKSLVDVLFYVSSWVDSSRRKELSHVVERSGSNKTSDAHAQLRALGFVA